MLSTNIWPHSVWSHAFVLLLAVNNQRENCPWGNIQDKKACFQMENRLQLIHPSSKSTQSSYPSSSETNPSIRLLLLLLFLFFFKTGLSSDTLAQGLQEYHRLSPSCCLFVPSPSEEFKLHLPALSLWVAPDKTASNANVNVNNRPAMVLVRIKALLGV